MNDVLMEGSSVVIGVMKDTATILVALAAVITALAVIWRSRVGWVLRWVVRKLISEPVAAHANQLMVAVIDREVRPAILTNRDNVQRLLTEFEPNGGQSMRDAVDRLAAGQHQLLRRLDVLEDRQTVILSRLRDVETQLPDGE